MALRQYGGYAALVVLLAASWGLVRWLEQEDTRGFQVPPHSAAYFSIAYHKTEYDARGQITSTLTAQRMTHYSDDGATHFEQPVMIFYHDDEPPWTVRAETGRLSADGQTLHLGGAVQVSRPAAPGFRALQLVTRELRVNPKTHYAATDEWAEVTADRDRTRGVGFSMVFQKPISLHFHSRVKGRYEPKKKKK